MKNESRGMNVYEIRDELYNRIGGDKWSEHTLTKEFRDKGRMSRMGLLAFVRSKPQVARDYIKGANETQTNKAQIMINSTILSDLAPTILEAINDEPTGKMIALCHLDNIKARSEFTTDEFSDEDFLSIQCELDAIRKQIRN